MTEGTSEQVPFDSLRVESSVLTPEEQEKLQSRVNKMQKIIEKKWGKFIPNEKKNEATDFPKKIIITDSDRFDTLYTDWNKKEPTELRKEEGMRLVLSELGTRYYSLSVLDEMKDGTPSTRLDRKAYKIYDNLLTHYGDNVHRLFFGVEVSGNVQQHVYSEFTHELVKEVLPDYYEEAMGSGIEITADNARGVTYTEDGLVVIKRKDSTEESQRIENHDLAHELMHMYEPSYGVKQ